MSDQPMITSVADGHMHLWFRHAQFTSVNAGHSHKLGIGIALANEPGGHNHLLLNQTPRR